MGIIHSILPSIQIALSVILIISILLQHQSASVGSSFGGTEGSSVHMTRRGFEKVLFITTIVVAILFAVSAFVAVLA